MPSVRLSESEAPGRLLLSERAGLFGGYADAMEGLDFLIYGPSVFDALTADDDPSGVGLMPT